MHAVPGFLFPFLIPSVSVPCCTLLPLNLLLGWASTVMVLIGLTIGPNLIGIGTVVIDILYLFYLFT